MKIPKINLDDVKARRAKYRAEYLLKNKDRVKAQRAEYESRPEVKDRVAEYISRPEVKAKRAAYYEGYYNRPEIRIRLAEYRARPEVQAKRAENYALPESKARREEYAARPEFKAQQQAYAAQRTAKLGLKETVAEYQSLLGMEQPSTRQIRRLEALADYLGRDIDEWRNEHMRKEHTDLLQPKAKKAFEGFSFSQNALRNREKLAASKEKKEKEDRLEDSASGDESIRARLRDMFDIVAPSKLRSSIKVGEKSVPTEYYGWKAENRIGAGVSSDEVSKFLLPANQTVIPAAGWNVPAHNNKKRVPMPYDSSMAFAKGNVSKFNRVYGDFNRKVFSRATFIPSVAHPSEKETRHAIDAMVLTKAIVGRGAPLNVQFEQGYKIKNNEPATHTSGSYVQSVPPQIRVYRIDREAGSTIRPTLLHELAHHRTSDALDTSDLDASKKRIQFLERWSKYTNLSDSPTKYAAEKDRDEDIAESSVLHIAGMLPDKTRGALLDSFLGSPELLRSKIRAAGKIDARGYVGKGNVDKEVENLFDNQPAIVKPWVGSPKLRSEVEIEPSPFPEFPNTTKVVLRTPNKTVGKVWIEGNDLNYISAKKGYGQATLGAAFDQTNAQYFDITNFNPKFWNKVGVEDKGMKRGRVTYEGYLASQLAKNKPGESNLPLSPAYKESFLGSDKLGRVPKDLPEDLVYEPTADEMDMTNKDAKEYEYKMESPLTRQIVKPEKEPDEDSSKYSGTEAEVEETLKGLEETSKKK